MSDMIMQLAGVIQRDIDTLKEVSQNVANANTTGYKAGRAFSVQALGQPASGVAVGLDGLQTQTSINTDGGALQYTGRVTDFALSGDAWFAVNTPQGAALTRDGRFQVDNQGFLVSHAGHPVLGQGGPIQVAGGVVKVSSLGEVSVDDTPVGQLSLVRIERASDLVSRGAGLYSMDVAWQPATQYVVHQGL